MSHAATRRRRLLGLRKRPGRVAVALFRMPLAAYRHDAGWMLGHAFLEFTHVGRSSGRRYETVAMVLGRDEAADETFICAAWGPQTDWYRNLQAAPAARVQFGRDSFVPQHRFLTDTEAYDVTAAFRRAHPHRFRLISAVLGWGDVRDDATLRALVRDKPFVAFRPFPSNSGPPMRPKRGCGR